MARADIAKKLLSLEEEKERKKQLKAKLLKIKLAIVRSPDKPKADDEFRHTRVDSNGPLINKVPFGDEDRDAKTQALQRKTRSLMREDPETYTKIRPPKPKQSDRKRIIAAKLLKIKLAGIDKKLNDIGKKILSEAQKQHDSQPLLKEVPFGKPNSEGYSSSRSKMESMEKMVGENNADVAGKKIRPKKPTQKARARIITAKLRLASIKAATPEARRDVIEKSKKTSEARENAKHETKKQTQLRLLNNSEHITTGGSILPPKENINRSLRKKLAQLKEQRMAQTHGHSIVFKKHSRGAYRTASLDSQRGKFAKYWLLNAKQTNGNGWGIAAHSAKTNMAKFIGRPLVITSSKWHGASVYGETYEHPYVPTNDLNQIFAHQEKFRVGTIVDVGESGGDYHATIEMLPKFANMTLPPFCSPAIYQLDAQEAEGQISKWEALHLAALDENPAYGARIALLKGTCVGTNQECKVQFKGAKLVKEASIACPIKVSALREKLAGFKEEKGFGEPTVNAAVGMTNPGGVDASKFNTKYRAVKQPKYINKAIGEGRDKTNDDKKADPYTVINSFSKKRLKKIAKLKLKLAAVGMPESFGDDGDTGANNKLPDLIPSDEVDIDAKDNEGFSIRNDLEDLIGESISEKPMNLNDIHKLLGNNPIAKMNTVNSNRIIQGMINNKILSNKGGIFRISQITKLKQKIANDFDDFAPVGQSTPKQKKQITRGRKIRGRNNEVERQVRKVKYNRRTDGGKNMENFDTPKPNEKEKLEETKGRITKNLPKNKVYSTPKRAGIEGDYSKPAQLKRKIAKLRLKLASQGEQNMTYQDSKKVVIHKKKHPEVRKANTSEFQHNDIEGALRKIHSSPLPTNERAHQSSFLSSTGDFIGGGEDHTETIKSIFKDKSFTPEDKGNDGPVTRFSIEHRLPRVQRRMTRRGGRVSFGIHSKLSRTQLNSILDLEKGGEEIGFVVGKDVNGTTGEGGRDLVKALREHKFL